MDEISAELVVSYGHVHYIIYHLQCQNVWCIVCQESYSSGITLLARVL